MSTQDTTSNEQKPSAEAIQRYDPVLADAPHDGCCAEMASHPEGRFVRHSDALAWVARVRREARAEAFEEAARNCYAQSEKHARDYPSLTDLAATAWRCGEALQELAAKERAK